jgi:hypothetical protein
MRNRFRRLPPRIEPLYETEDVTPPRPLPEVRETNWLTPGGEVAGFTQLADALARDDAVSGRLPARRPTRHRLLVSLLALFALMFVAAAVIGLTR